VRTIPTVEILSTYVLDVTLISNNPSFHHKHMGDPVDSDISDGTSHPLMESYMLPVPQVMGHFPNLLAAG
jgi:hypothetical protein